MSTASNEGDRIPMSQRERDRLRVLHTVLDGQRTQAEAARLLRRTPPERDRDRLRSRCARDFAASDAPQCAVGDARRCAARKPGAPGAGRQPGPGAG